MTDETKKIPAEQFMGDFSSKMVELVELTEGGLFGDVWNRQGLSKRDRSLATISALIALRASEQLTGHLKLGIANGLTQDEIAELITHMAFYSGWPSAFSAIAVAKKVFESMFPHIAPIPLLLCSDVFMTFAWVSRGCRQATKWSSGPFRVVNARSVSDGPGRPARI